MSDFHLLNRSAGLFYLGRFKEALEGLKTVDRNKLHKSHQCLYLIQIFANLLGDGQVQQAREFIEENKEWLAAFPKKPEIMGRLGVIIVPGLIIVRVSWSRAAQFLRDHCRKISRGS